MILHCPMMHRWLPAAKRPLDACLDAPPSKSVTHRALVAAALADGVSTVARPLDALDTRATVSGLEALGFPVVSEAGDLLVHGRGGRVAGGGRLDLNESGTSLRLLTAVAALGRASSRLDGAVRLQRRPLGPLTRALGSLGARVSGHGLPMTVGGTPFHGGEVSVPGSPSSQFASALMLIGPCLAGGLTLHIEPPAVSLPYIALTAEVMRAFGAEATRVEDLEWRIGMAPYVARTYLVEGDHSSASYFLAAPLIAGGRVRIRNLNSGSRQADACFSQILARLGAVIRTGTDWIEVGGSGELAGFDVSLNHAPDLVPTVAMLGLFASGASVIRDVPHLRSKESDRLHQLAVNLQRLGRVVRVCGDRLEIDASRAEPDPFVVETDGDHRIAMAFALAGLRVPGLAIDDADCVTKSNPGFWTDWNAMLGTSG